MYKENKVTHETARFRSLPKYIFAQIEELVERYRNKGYDLIDLGIGDPNFDTPRIIVDSMIEAVREVANHHYPSFKGEKILREAVCEWYMKKYNVSLDPEKEVLILIGSKEGLAHIPMVYIENGDYGLVPDPGYPAYASAIILSDGIPFHMVLKKDRDFFPDFSEIPVDIAKKSKLMYLNYPNNPTAAAADKEKFISAIEFAADNDIIICHDFAYSEIMFNHNLPVSFLSVPRAKEVGIEFHSFSKTFAMTGWRIGFVTGNADIIRNLGRVKSCMDSGVFKAVQAAAVAGLKYGGEFTKNMVDSYRQRRDMLYEGLLMLGFECNKPEGTYYFWVKIPDSFNMTSIPFCEYLVRKAGIVVTPGIGFGKHGDDYFRIAINIRRKVIDDTLNRLKKFIDA